MRTVFHPRLSAEETTAAVTTLEEQIAANGGEMLSTDNWGRRRLAYPIDGVVDGTYVLMTFNLPAQGAAPLERWIGISETTIRHLLIRGIIPFEGDRGRDRDDRGRDDDDRGRDRDERGDGDERGSAEPGEPRAEAASPMAPVADAAPAAEGADTPAEETSSEGSEQPAAEATAASEPSEGEPSENESSEDED
jgi:small subunit ribosomal protein S6